VSRKWLEHLGSCPTHLTYGGGVANCFPPVTTVVMTPGTLPRRLELVGCVEREDLAEPMNVLVAEAEDLVGRPTALCLRRHGASELGDARGGGVGGLVG